MRRGANPRGRAQGMFNSKINCSDCLVGSRVSTAEAVTVDLLARIDRQQLNAASRSATAQQSPPHNFHRRHIGKSHGKVLLAHLLGSPQRRLSSPSTNSARSGRGELSNTRLNRAETAFAAIRRASPCVPALTPLSLLRALSPQCLFSETPRSPASFSRRARESCYIRFRPPPPPAHKCGAPSPFCPCFSRPAPSRFATVPDWLNSQADVRNCIAARFSPRSYFAHPIRAHDSATSRIDENADGPSRSNSPESNCPPMS